MREKDLFSQLRCSLRVTKAGSRPLRFAIFRILIKRQTFSRSSLFYTMHYNVVYNEWILEIWQLQRVFCFTQRNIILPITSGGLYEINHMLSIENQHFRENIYMIINISEWNCKVV
jgi:hypothetical protein